MIKHIVLLKIKEGVEGRSKAESIAEAVNLIDAMNGKIPGLIKVEAAADFSATDASADMALYSEFESREALQVYADHPEHKIVLAYLKTVISDRQLIDYEI